jgi:NitT/TauT family transport system permease protein
MAGELIVVIGGRGGLGFALDSARLNFDYASLESTMIVILVIGIVVDSLVFGVLERRVRRRWGLVDAAAA